MSKPTTGQQSHKLYRCSKCGYEKQINTNHWGPCYSLFSYNACPACPPFKRPTTWRCCEDPPETHERAADWNVVKLGNLVTIKTKG